MSETKQIPTIASIAEGDSLVIKRGGSVCSAPLSTLVAPASNAITIADNKKNLQRQDHRRSQGLGSRTCASNKRPNRQLQR